MKKKTAMMEAFDHLKLWIDSGLSPDNWFKNFEASHLEKEKEQIIEAFDYASNSDDKEYAEKYYYNETYKND